MVTIEFTIERFLNAGYLDALTTDQLNLIQKILTAKVSNYDKPLFELPYTDDLIVLKYVDKFYTRMVAEKRIDVLVDKKEKKKSKNSDLENIYISSIRNKDVREIGAEWLSYQAANQLQIGAFLEAQGWSEEDRKLALSHIISRAVYPASEFETSRWIKENSSVCETTGFEVEKSQKTAFTQSQKDYMLRRKP